MDNHRHRSRGGALLLIGLLVAALAVTFSLLGLLAGPANASPDAAAGPGFADVEVAKSARPEPVLAGGALTYTVTITNHGPSPATGVGLIDTLPAAVTLAQTPAGCSGGNQLICSLSDIPNGGATVISYQVTVSPTFTGAMTNTVVVAAAESDPVGGNDLAQVQSLVVPRPVVGFAQATFVAAENVGMAPITVTLDVAPAITVTVEYGVAAGSATAGQDFVTASGSLTFTPGVTSQAFTVTILNDVLHEMSETIALTLSAPVNASLGLASADLTILDDDAYVVYLPVIIKP